MTSELKKTPLYETYVNSGAKIVEFGGWAMPVNLLVLKKNITQLDTKWVCSM